MNITKTLHNIKNENLYKFIDEMGLFSSLKLYEKEPMLFKSYTLEHKENKPFPDRFTKFAYNYYFIYLGKVNPHNYFFLIVNKKTKDFNSLFYFNSAFIKDNNFFIEDASYIITNEKTELFIATYHEKYCYSLEQ